MSIARLLTMLLLTSLTAITSDEVFIIISWCARSHLLMKQPKTLLVSLHKPLINKPTFVFHNTNTAIASFSTMLQLHFYVIFTSFLKESLKNSRTNFAFDYTKACSCYWTLLHWLNLGYMEVSRLREESFCHLKDMLFVNKSNNQ